MEFQPGIYNKKLVLRACELDRERKKERQFLLSQAVA